LEEGPSDAFMSNTHSDIALWEDSPQIQTISAKKKKKCCKALIEIDSQIHGPLIGGDLGANGDIGIRKVTSTRKHPRYLENMPELNDEAEPTMGEHKNIVCVNIGDPQRNDKFIPCDFIYGY
jgi:hypothetical protein